MLILALQFYDGDKQEAMALAKLIADIETERRDDVAFVFSARNGTSADPAVIRYVEQKFTNVFSTVSKSKRTGWPAGCNDLMAETYAFCINLVRTKKVQALGVLLMEADAVPLAKDWINQLKEEYKLCLDAGKFVMGPWLKKGDAPLEHVNGNCILHIDFWQKCKVILRPPVFGGWDATLASNILPHAYPSKLMWSDYHLDTPRNPWRGCDYLWQAKRYGAKENKLYGQDIFPVWLHAAKGYKAMDCVRDRLLSQLQLKKKIDMRHLVSSR